MMRALRQSTCMQELSQLRMGRGHTRRASGQVYNVRGERERLVGGAQLVHAGEGEGAIVADGAQRGRLDGLELGALREGRLAVVIKGHTGALHLQATPSQASTRLAPTGPLLALRRKLLCYWMAGCSAPAWRCAAKPHAH